MCAQLLATSMGRALTRGEVDEADAVGIGPVGLSARYPFPSSDS